MSDVNPRYPVYVISKGRAHRPLTAAFLTRDRCPFRIVVEPQEEAEYRKALPDADIAVLPFSNLGQGSMPARNWCWEDAKQRGHEKHWILDDNIAGVRRYYRFRRLPVNSRAAFAAVEDFVGRYENVPIAGMNYHWMAMPGISAFTVNCHVYSCLLIQNDVPYRWRLRYNEDTDLCLQVLADGYCTILVNVFTIFKRETMMVKGGNTDELYKEGNTVGDGVVENAHGRLRMARLLEQTWPKYVRVDWRYGRAQHIVDWKQFKRTKLKLREGVDLNQLPKVNEYSLVLVPTEDLSGMPRMQNLLDEWRIRHESVS